MKINNDVFEKFPEIKYYDFDQKNDERGYFVKTFSRYNFFDKDISFDEIYHSTSRKNVIRGIHYQHKPHGLDKFVICIEGEIKDLVIDLRKKSSTYLDFDTTKLNKNTGLFVPYGFGHGFSILSEYATVLYCQSGQYNSESEGGINPLSLAVDWEVESPILSKRDASLESIDTFRPEL